MTTQTTFNKRAAFNFMVANIASHVYAGEVNTTTLVEDYCSSVSYDAMDWLTDELHDVWEVASDVANRYERGQAR